MINSEPVIEPKDLFLFTIEQHSLKLDRIMSILDDIDNRLIRIEERMGFKDKIVTFIISIITKPAFWWVILLIGASLNFDLLTKLLNHYLPLK